MRSGGRAVPVSCGVAVCVVIVPRYGGGGCRDMEATGRCASGFPYPARPRQHRFWFTVSMTTHEGEEHGAGLGQRLNWLRAGVLGANDGIVSVAALVVG